MVTSKPVVQGGFLWLRRAGLPPYLLILPWDLKRDTKKNIKNKKNFTQHEQGGGGDSIFFEKPEEKWNGLFDV